VFDWCQTLQTGDVDNDGDTDVLAAMFPRWPAPSYPVRIYYNQGGGMSWSSQQLADTGIYHGVLGDLGSDGDLDVVGLRNYDSPPIEIWENKLLEPCVLAYDDWTYIELDSSRARWGDWDTPSWASYLGLAFGDLTGDGLVDMVSGRYFYRNPGGDMAGPWPRVDLGLNCDANLVVDVDGDRLGDVMASAGDTVYWLEAVDREGSAWNAVAVDTAFPRPGHGNPQGYGLAQLHGAGRPELLLHELDVYAYSIPPDPEAGNWPRTLVVNNSNGEGIGVGDIDRDGDFDIAVAHHPPDWTEGDPRHIKWCPNPGDGSGNWPEVLIGSIDGNWADRLAVADLNGDGRDDIIVTEEEQPVTPDWKTYWFQAPADPTTPDWTRHVLVTQYTTNSLEVADMDRDGDLDIVLGEHRGTRKLAIWDNDGVGNFTERVVDTGKESHLGARVADLNGDGAPEIASICWDDYPYLHLWRNDNACGSVNRPPSVDAGDDQLVVFPVSLVSLDATVSDDGLPSGTLVTSWSQQDGPPGVVFADPSAVDTDALLPGPGSYLLRLTADDGEHLRFDELIVTVMPRGSDLVLHWTFDDAAGDTARDVTPYGNHGTLSAASWTTGPLGGALAFDGATSYVARSSGQLNGPFPAVAPEAEDFTVTAWVRLDSTGERNPIAGKQSNQQRGFMLMTESDDTLTLEVFRDDTVGGSVGATTPLVAGPSYHVAASYEFETDGTSRVRLFVDGTPAGGSDAMPGPLALNSTAFEVGRYYWSPSWSGYMHGMIDDVRVYARALNGCEIARVMSGAADLDGDGLPDAWELDRLGDTTPGAADDPDADGAANFEEYLLGTDPLDRDSLLVVLLVKSGTAVEASFQSLVAEGVGYECEQRAYTTEDAPAPGPAAWTPLASCSGLAATGDRLSCSFDPAPDSRYYRVRASLGRN
jgi:hypothetical protein